MATYEPVKDPNVLSLLNGAVQMWHGDLADAGVTIGLEWCWADESKPGKGKDKPDRAPLKLRGYPVPAVPSVNGYRHRARGAPDCLITIDEAHWRDHLDDKQRAALLDHELHHFEVVKDGKGFVKEDKAGRPRIKMRPHDIEIGGFAAVIARHGGYALESLATLQAAKDYPSFRQLFLFDETDGPAEITIALPGRETVTVRSDQLHAVPAQAS